MHQGTLGAEQKQRRTVSSRLFGFGGNVVPTGSKYALLFYVESCGGFGENGFHGFPYLNAWFPVSGTICDRLGGVALVERVCHWKWALRFKNPSQSPRPLCLSVSLTPPPSACFLQIRMGSAQLQLQGHASLFLPMMVDGRGLTRPLTL